MTVDSWIIDSASAVNRAGSNATAQTYYAPGGACLEHQWAFQSGGRTSVLGQQGIVVGTAQEAWERTVHKVYASENIEPFDGAPVYFGPSPTRTDKNKNAGDVVTYSRARKMVAATDVYGNRMGWQTIPQRAAYTSRPYNGFGLDMLGNMTSGGLQMLQTTSDQTGDSGLMSDAQYAALTAGIASLAADQAKANGYMRREARMRWYIDQDTGDGFLAKLNGVPSKAIYCAKANLENRDAAYQLRLMVAADDLANAQVHALPHAVWLGIPAMAACTDVAFDASKYPTA